MDAAGDSSTTAERLRELQRLRDDDLISDEEFEAQRARILDEAFGPGQTEMASGSSADGPDGSDADALSDEGATSSPPEDQPKPDPPGERVVNPARWPNWLRITAIVLSGIWIVTIPFMLWRAARYTWLPYFGVATAVVLILGIAAGIEGDEADQPAPAAAPRPAATAARTPAPRSTPTPPSYQTGRWVSGYVPTTVTEAMDDRDSCRDDATTGDDAWQAGIAVLIVQRGHTECLGWMRVRNRVRAHESTWIRHEYVANAAATPTPTSPPLPTPVSVGDINLTLRGLEAYDSSRHNYLNDANVRVEVEAVNARGAADSEYTIDSSYFRLVDENGIAHDADWLCTDCPDQISYIDLVRGGRVRGYVYFTIPEGRRLVELIYEPLFSRNKARFRVPRLASASTATPAAPTPTPEGQPTATATPVTLPEDARPPDVVWVHLTLAGSGRTGLDVASRGGPDDLGRISVTVGRPYYGIKSFGRPTSMLRSDETYEGWGYLDFVVLISSETLVTVQWGLYGEAEPIEIDYVCTGPETTYREHGAPGAGGIWECSLP